MKKIGICLLWSLFFGGVLYPGPAPANSSEPQLSPILNLSPDLVPGLDAFRAREYDRAYDLLLRAFEAEPGNFLVNFYLGRAAFEAGHYEMAVMVFDRAMMLRPRDPRIKLEMARAYQRLGLNDMARRYCREVLLADPPWAVKENIERFLAYIDRTEKRHFFTGSLALGFDWNDNVWSSPSYETIRIFGTEISLDGVAAGEKEDMIYSARAGLNHTYSFPYSRLAWQTRGNAYSALFHEQKGLNTLYLDIETGPEVLKEKGVAGFMVTAEYLDLDRSKYSSALGARAYYQFTVSPSMVLMPGIAYQSRAFERNAGRNSDHLDLTLGSAFRFRGFWWSPSLGFEHESAADDEYSYDRWRFELGVSREIRAGLTLFGSYDFEHTDYEEESIFFTHARVDNTHYLGLGIRKSLWQSRDMSRSMNLTLGYRYTKADSNLDLYDYEKNNIYSFMEYRF
ncbi:surface lipoprotein assembly modifier [Desulfospira joergensenii]|uniref:surface lipoprotein assembly modifier n=1 Tax=Desulfospira joergensenii TaxID=53329 RepID=UPI0003B4E13C|nr:surface lipoprotein assembly modifier [Desulfospira joergensenii]